MTANSNTVGIAAAIGRSEATVQTIYQAATNQAKLRSNLRKGLSTREGWEPSPSNFEKQVGVTNKPI
jgi:hypothetical protein